MASMAGRDTKADEQGYERVCAELMGVAEERSAAMFGGTNVVVLRELNTKLLESKALRRVWSDLAESRRADAVFEIGAAAAQEFLEQALKAYQGKSTPLFLGPYAEYDLAEARRNLEALQRTIELVKDNERELEDIDPRPLDSDLLAHLDLVQTPPRPLTRLRRFAGRKKAVKLSDEKQEAAAKARRERVRSAPVDAANPREALVLLLHLYEELLREVILLEWLELRPKEGSGRPSEPGTWIATACHLDLEGLPVSKYRMQRAEELVKEFLELPHPPDAGALYRRFQKAVTRARKALEKSTP